MTPDELPWIGCDLLRLEHDFRRHAAILYLHDGDCVDMTAAIKLVERIDPHATSIRTIAGDKEDTEYARGTDRKWVVRYIP